MHGIEAATTPDEPISNFQNTIRQNGGLHINVAIDIWRPLTTRTTSYPEHPNNYNPFKKQF